MGQCDDSNNAQTSISEEHIMHEMTVDKYCFFIANP